MEKFNFENKKGVEQEVNYLGVINNNLYLKNVKNALTDSLVVDYLDKNRVSRNPKDLLASMKRSNREALKEVVGNVSDDVERIMQDRIVNNRHIFLKEIDADDQYKIIEKSQGLDVDPCDPKTDFANDLHATIVEDMGADYSDLEYYSATGTHLDYCGVDAFFKFNFKNDNGEDNFVRVSIDLTSNSVENKAFSSAEKAKSGGRSFNDLILFINDETYDRKKQEHQNIVKEAAKKIIEKINTKIEASKKLSKS